MALINHDHVVFQLLVHTVQQDEPIFIEFLLFARSKVRPVTVRLASLRWRFNFIILWCRAFQ